MQDSGYGHCQCGCGEKTQIAAKTNTKQRQVKGRPNRFLAGHRPKKHPDYLEEARGYTTPCWIWQGGKDRLGYGLVKRPEHQGVAHIWYYKKVIGPVPEGTELDHLCRVRSCVNPDHLEAVTHEANVKRGESFSAHNARKTHCVHGHPFSPENTYIRPSTSQRECRICRSRAYAEWQRNRRGITV